MNSIYKKKINYGFEILRMLMEFWIILNHLYKPKKKIIQKIIIEHKFHVPTFIIMSFYFLYNNLSKRKIKKIKDRLERLFIPYILYPILSYIINNFFYIFFKFKNLKTSLYQLILQLIVGRELCKVLWFHFNLILITIFFYLISFIFKNYYLYFLQIIGIFSYLIQFSEINFNYFNRFRNTISLSVGYFAETIPLAVTGLFIAFIDIINKSKKNLFMAFFFSFSFIFMFFKYDIFTPVKGFGKQGIMYNIGGVSFFLIFSLIPLDNLNKRTLFFIKLITSFTPGIYFLHFRIYDILKYKISLIKDNSFFGCLIIYLICYSLSFLGYKLFINTKLKYLFI